MNARNTLMRTAELLTRIGAATFVWLARIGGVGFVLVGLDFFVSVWRERSFQLALLGFVITVVGVVLISTRIVGDRVQFVLLHWRRK